MKKCKKTTVKLDDIYGDLSPPIKIIRYWFNEFDEERPGSPADMVTKEKILRGLGDKMREVAEVIGISYGTVISRERFRC